LTAARTIDVLALLTADLIAVAKPRRRAHATAR
jgi:hypothetical protein